MKATTKTVRIGSLKAFNAALAEIAKGEVDNFGAGYDDDRKVGMALRRFANLPKNGGRFSELIAYIIEAEEKGFHARQANRSRLSRELAVKARQEAYESVSRANGWPY